MKMHNFYAGPSILPQETIKSTADALINFAGTGLSLMEVSHRSKEFIAVMDETRSLFKSLLNVPEGYEVVFIGGGASLQFSMVPFNIMNKKSAYLVTGEWATKAHKEAKAFGEAVEVATSKDKNFSYIPKDFVVPTDAEYLHVTSNNTIYGTQLHKDFDVNVPMVADMSSDIFSRPIDISKYSIIYGGAQKNLAPAGLTFAIVKIDALGKVDRPIPTMLNYTTHIKGESMFNTPPVVPVYAALQTLKWLKAKGGVEAMAKINQEKAALLYNEIDSNKLFKGTAALEDRSLMNICFVMNDEYKELEKEFDQYALSQGLVGITGHRSVGGFRASTYNALPIESVQALVTAMQTFAKKH